MSRGNQEQKISQTTDISEVLAEHGIDIPELKPQKKQKNPAKKAREKAVKKLTAAKARKLTKELAKYLAHLVKTGQPISKQVNGTAYLNIPENKLQELGFDAPIKYNQYYYWYHANIVPVGMRVGLRDIIDRAKDFYEKSKRRKLLKMAESVLMEDLSMDTTVSVVKKVPTAVEQQLKNGKIVKKIVDDIKEIKVISPKLRQIRNETAKFIASTIGKNIYNTSSQAANIAVFGDNNNVSVAQVSLIDLRKREQSLIVNTEADSERLIEEELQDVVGDPSSNVNPNLDFDDGVIDVDV